MGLDKIASLGSCLKKSRPHSPRPGPRDSSDGSGCVLTGKAAKIGLFLQLGAQVAKEVQKSRNENTSRCMRKCLLLKERKRNLMLKNSFQI